MKTSVMVSENTEIGKLDAEILAHLIRAYIVSKSYVLLGNLREVCVFMNHGVSLIKLHITVKSKIHSIMNKCTENIANQLSICSLEH